MLSCRIIPGLGYSLPPSQPPVKEVDSTVEESQLSGVTQTQAFAPEVQDSQATEVGDLTQQPTEVPYVQAGNKYEHRSCPLKDVQLVPKFGCAVPGCPKELHYICFENLVLKDKKSKEVLPPLSDPKLVTCNKKHYKTATFNLHKQEKAANVNNRHFP